MNLLFCILLEGLKSSQKTKMADSTPNLNGKGFFYCNVHDFFPIDVYIKMCFVFFMLRTEIEQWFGDLFEVTGDVNISFEW